MVGIAELRMMIHDLGLDRDLHDEGDGVAKGLELERGFDIGRLDRPFRQFGQRRADFGVAQNLEMRHAGLLRHCEAPLAAAAAGLSRSPIPCSSAIDDPRMALVYGLSNSRPRKIR